MTALPLLCRDCGAPAPPLAPLCLVCGGHRLTDSGVCTPSDPGPPESLDLPWPWRILGAWPAGHSVALAGSPGGGKSTLAALVAGWWGDRQQGFAWLTSEQTGAEVAALHRRVCPRWCGRVDVWPIKGLPALQRALDGVHETFVVLDSISAMAGYEDQARAVGMVDDWLQRKRNRRALLIQQRNGRGEAAGKVEIQHMVDATALIDQVDGQRMLVVTKNRAGPTANGYFAIDANGVCEPGWADASYSVEGEPGAYSLLPWPLKGGRWAGLLDALADADLMRPGLASAGVPVEGYPNRCLQPADLAQRQAFAAAHGLAWLDPAEIPSPPEELAKPARKRK